MDDPRVGRLGDRAWIVPEHPADLSKTAREHKPGAAWRIEDAFWLRAGQLSIVVVHRDQGLD
jgi:hypothetical protein